MSPVIKTELGRMSTKRSRKRTTNEGFPYLDKPSSGFRMSTLSSKGPSRKEESVNTDDLDALPTIDEMAANFNYQKNIQPFDLMDNDLQKLVEELKRKKKSKDFTELPQMRQI